MEKTLLALAPPALAAIYYFGWRSLAVICCTVLVAVLCEWLFCRRRGEPVSSAVFVTAILYALTLPPGVPWMVVIVGIVVAIVFGKEVFGGFGRNVFNPALVGRCFVYVAFPQPMTGRWYEPMTAGWGGFVRWMAGADAVTHATPLKVLKSGQSYELGRLLLGNISGSLGETSAALIIIGGLYLVYTRAANWRIPASILLGVAASSILFRLLDHRQVAPPLHNILAGGMMFGAVYMATDPVSAPNTDEARWIYGLGIGILAVIIRAFGQFSCGVMFAILFMNMFAPITDHYVGEIRKRRRAAAPDARRTAGAQGKG